MKKFKLYTDGSYEKKLGIASIGGYIMNSDNEVIFRFSEKLTAPSSFKHHESNAVVYGLNKALELGINDIECFSDDKSISDAFNKMPLNFQEAQKILSHPYKSQIAALINKFSHIHFHYLPRVLNKEADKLAGKNLKEHKQDNIVLKKRKHFIGQEEKLLYIPNLICEEDYQEKNTNMQEFSQKRKQLSNYYLINIVRDSSNNDDIMINYYNIERNPKDHRDLKSEIIHTQQINQKDLVVEVFKNLTNLFQNSEAKKEIGVVFDVESNFLRYPEMILRKRATLHKTDTQLINDLRTSSHHLNMICLDNDEKLIKNHHELLTKNIHKKVSPKL